MVGLVRSTRYVLALASPAPPAPLPRSGFVLRPTSRHSRPLSTAFIRASVAGHNLLMIGPPGAGKSLLASCLPGILPPLSPAEALEVSMVQSVAGTLEEGRISSTRPFRAPHHSASMAALTGGGVKSLGKRDSAPHRARFSFRVTGGKLNKFRKAITYRACALRPTFFCQPSIPRIFG